MEKIMLHLFAVSSCLNVFLLLYSIPKSKRETRYWKHRSTWYERYVDEEFFQKTSETEPTHKERKYFLISKHKPMEKFTLVFDDGVFNLIDSDGNTVDVFGSIQKAKKFCAECGLTITSIKGENGQVIENSDNQNS